MIQNYNKIERLFTQIDDVLEHQINVFVIGGAVLLQQDLKDGTKDIDLVLDSKIECETLQHALVLLHFKTKIPGREYEHMNLDQIFEKEDFRIDSFYKEVCGKFSLSKGMMNRANLILDLNKLKVFHCCNEDVFLFKTMTEREGDLDDCVQLGTLGLNWKIILEELKNQIEKSKKDIWITWVGERLDLLEEKGLEITIMKEINELRDQYFETLDR